MAAAHWPTDQRPHRLSPDALLRALGTIYAPCVLCEHRCGAMRPDGERGACGLDHRSYVYNRMVHLGEERELVPSYTIFLSGCSMLCSFCSEHAHLRPPFEEAATDPEALAQRVASHLGSLRSQVPWLRNINFVGGEPSIQLPFLARFAASLSGLLGAASLPPLLLNTNGYLTPEALALSSHLCAILLVDLKFGDDGCAERIGDVPRYTEVLHRNIAWIAQANRAGAAGIAITAGEARLLPVELWVRHLLMPGHLACCTAPALRWLATHAPEARVNVMPAFVPFGGGSNTSWRELAAQERAEALELLRSLPLRDACFDGRRLSA